MIALKYEISIHPVHDIWKGQTVIVSYRALFPTSPDSDCVEINVLVVL